MYTTFGKKILNYKINNNIKNMQELAVMINGINRATLSQWIRGKGSPNRTNQIRLMEIIPDIKPEDFFNTKIT